MYLHNLRLWQLETLSEMELEHHKLKSSLPYSLDVTSLILAFSSPISIRFRMDEKRFDVDGSYNARYEVVKKRIDKAYLADGQERLRKPGYIAVIYMQDADKTEYLEYLHNLIQKGYLAGEIESLEVEKLQGVEGLRALRG